MNPNNALLQSAPTFGTPTPVPIRLNHLKLPAGIAKPKALPHAEHQSAKDTHASAKTISTTSGIAPKEVAEMALPATPLTPDNAAAFGCVAPHKKPVRQVPIVNLEGDGYLRLEDVLAVYPVSRSAWYAGIQQGIYPAPVPLGRRSVGWSRAAIRALIERPPKF